MNKKLETLFDLPEMPDVDTEPVSQPTIPELRNTLDMGKRIDSALNEVTDIDSTEKDLDNLAAKAEEAFDTLMNLGANMDDRSSGKIFEVAATMLKNAVDAKHAKLDKKLRIIELQLRKEKMDRDANNKSQSINGPVVDAVVLTGRNELLDEMMKKLSNSSTV